MSTPSWYSIRASKAASEPAEVRIYGEIGDGNWFEESVSAQNFVRELDAISASEMRVRIHSLGGSVPDGIAIFNAIKNHPAKVTTTIDGVAMSIASMIFMAGDDREMPENTAFMTHAPWGVVAGNAVQLRKTAEQMDYWAATMASSYTAGGMPKDDALAMLSDAEDHYFTAEQAIQNGFATKITGKTDEKVVAKLDPKRVKSYSKTMPAAAMRFFTTEPATPAQSAAPAVDTEKLKMTQTVDTPDVAAIQASAVAADKARRDGIKAAFAGKYAAMAGAKELQEQCEADPKCDAGAAGLKLLALVSAQAAPVQGSVRTVEDETDKRIHAHVQALMVRGNVATDEQRNDINANPYRGAKLLDIAKASLERAGVKTAGWDQMRIVGSAFTQGTSDFPLLLENTMHKAMQQAYALAPDTWSQWCSTGSVSDFRAHNRYRVGSLGNLQLVNELAEFKNAAIPDGEKSTISAQTKGLIVNLSRQAVINDDMNALVGIPAAQGRSAKRTVEADAYAALTSNGGLGPVLNDGLTLFHASHNNISAGTPVSVEAFDVDRVLMAQQMDVSKNDFLDLRPSIILVPISLGGNVRVINGAQYDPDTVNKLQRPNKVNGLFSNIVDTPRLTGTRRYIFAATSDAPVMEVAFLDGNSTPYMEMEKGFDVDGARWKVRLDYGIAAIDYRGAITNAGV